MRPLLLLLVLLKIVFVSSVISPPEQTRWPDQPINFTSPARTKGFFHAILENDTKIKLQVNCVQNDGGTLEFEVRWLLRYSECAGLYYGMKEEDAFFVIEWPTAMFWIEEYNDVIANVIAPGYTSFSVYSPVSFYRYKCGEPVQLEDLTNQNWVRIHPIEESKQVPARAIPSFKATEVEQRDKKDGNGSVTTAMKKPETEHEKTTTTAAESAQQQEKRQAPPKNTNRDNVINSLIYKTMKSGPFMLVVDIVAVNTSLAKTVEAKGTYTVEFVGPNGYLSANNYPMLGFSAVLCAVYGIFAFVWIVFGALHWKDLLRVQFWIGAVIGLGLIEQAVILCCYEKTNQTGLRYPWVQMAAELINLLKRTLARSLVLIVSFGYGLVKPRLGSLMNNVVVLCLCYFILEATMLVLFRRKEFKVAIILSLLQLVTDCTIYWWVFSSLRATLKNLKLRRNIVKLAVYRHFYNTLIVCIVTAIIFTLWVIRMHGMPDCITDWRYLWIEDAFWQVLFCVILFVMIILWRPSQNNKRYAFSPFMDHEEDEEQEEPCIGTENSNSNQEVQVSKSVSNYEKNIVCTATRKKTTICYGSRRESHHLPILTPLC